MITRDDLRELSQFRFREDGQCAVSFYFQPTTPRNKSHREETILVKDLVRHALQTVAQDGNDPFARADLQRILQTAEQLHGNQARAKAIFADGRRKFWREFDLPPALPRTQLFVNRRFHLKPLAALLGAQPQLGVVLLDRQRARLFDLRLDELTERLDLFHALTRRGRSDGFAGYDAGHAERRVADDVLHHFKNVAAALKDQAEKGTWEKLILGCQEKSWHEFEPQLHPLVRGRVIGHFFAEVATASNERIRERAAVVLHDWWSGRSRELVNEVLSEAKGHRKGVTGLRRVLRSLQLGEVQTLLIGERYQARGVECSSCGYIDSHIVRHCASCGRATEELDDIGDAIIAAAIRRDIELLYVKDSPDLDAAGNIAALLRFRSARSQPAAVA